MRRSSFAVTVSAVTTAYLVVATLWLATRAVTPADRAVVHGLGVLTGAVAILAIALFVRWANEPDEDADKMRLPVGFRSLDEHGEVEDDD